MLTQLQTFWGGLDPRRRLIAALGALAIVASLVGIARVATTPSMSLLYSGLDAAAAGEVVASLEARGVVHEVRDAAIYVDAARRDVRFAVADPLAIDGCTYDAVTVGIRTTWDSDSSVDLDFWTYLPEVGLSFIIAWTGADGSLASTEVTALERM